MSDYIKKPYEISIWEDELITEYWAKEAFTYKDVSYAKNTKISWDVASKYCEDEHKNFDDCFNTIQYFDEYRVAVIGSDTMTSPIRALEPSLKRNVNGTTTLHFYLYMRYYDEETDTYKQNPYIQSLLVNERKLKLRYDDEWYDFIIKSATEDSEANTLTIDAYDLFINELSKTGFNIEFDTDLGNNIGTVTDLAEQIVKDTEWEVDNNLLDQFATIENPTEYLAYKVPLKDSLIQGSTYTLQLWDVNISHSGKSSNQLKVGVWWGNGSTDSKIAYLNVPFGSAEHLAVTFTVSEKLATSPGAKYKQLLFYNSPSKTEGDMNLTIGAWKLQEGTNATGLNNPLLERRTSNLYKIKLNKDTSVVSLTTNQTFTIPANEYVYGFYSSVLDYQKGEAKDLQVIYDFQQTYAVDEDRVILERLDNVDEYTADEYTFTVKNKSDITIADISYEYKGRRLIQGLPTIYDPVTEKVVERYNYREYHSVDTSSYSSDITYYIYDNGTYEEADPQPTGIVKEEDSYFVRGEKAEAYMYYENEYYASEVVKNLVNNGENIVNEEYWRPVYTNASYATPVIQVSAPEITTDGLSYECFHHYLKVGPFTYPRNDPEWTDAMKAYRRTILAEDFTYNLPGATGFVKGDEYVFRFSGGYSSTRTNYPNETDENKFNSIKDSTYDPPKPRIEKVYIRDYKINDKGNVTFGPNIYFQSSTNPVCRFKEDGGKDRRWDGTWCLFIGDSFNSKVDYYEVNSSGNYVKTKDKTPQPDKKYYYTRVKFGYRYLTMKCITPLTKHEMLSGIRDYTDRDKSGWKVGLFIRFSEFTSTIANYYLEGIQLFQKRMDATNKNILIPGDVPDTSVEKKYYCYKKPEENEDIQTIDDVKWLYQGTQKPTSNDIADLAPYSPPGNERYEKKRTISAKESNRFNLIQELCETFECWAKFVVERDSNGKILTEYRFDDDGVNATVRHRKSIQFLEFIGKDNYAGFKYGVNLKQITRDLKSDQIVTKLIVKNNSNEHAPNGFCTIARASENPNRSNFILNVDYYIRQGMLTAEEWTADLYSTQNGHLGYYKILRELLDDFDKLTTERAEADRSVDNLMSTKTTVEEALNAAKKNKNSIVKKIRDRLSKDGYKGYYETKDPTPNSGKQYYTKDGSKFKKAPKPLSKFFKGVTYYEYLAQGKLTEAQVVTVIKGEANSASKYKTDDQAKNFAAQYDKFASDISYYSPLLTNTKSALKKAENRIKEIEDEISDKKLQIVKIEKEFNRRYARFIQEGTWIDESYVDDNLYFLDGESVLYDSAFPKVSYTINVVEISNVDNYKLYSYTIGDKTFVEDTEFFGYYLKNGIMTPYQEEVVVSETTNFLDSPEKNTITVQNYKTQFDDLFQRIAATTQGLQYASGSYERAASSVNSNGTIDASLIQNSFAQNSINLSNARDQSVLLGSDGLTATNLSNPLEILRITSGGLYVSNDGGTTYTAGVTANGINTELLSSGQINTNKISIFSDSFPNFIWDRYGLSAYETHYEETYSEVNYGTFVRHDQYGLYGIKNNHLLSDWHAGQGGVDPLEDIRDRGTFGLLWDGFFLKSTETGGMVRISTTDDIQILSPYTPTRSNTDEREIYVFTNQDDFQPYTTGVEADIYYNKQDVYILTENKENDRYLPYYGAIIPNETYEYDESNEKFVLTEDSQRQPDKDYYEKSDVKYYYLVETQDDPLDPEKTYFYRSAMSLFISEDESAVPGKIYYTWDDETNQFVRTDTYIEGSTYEATFSEAITFDKERQENVVYYEPVEEVGELVDGVNYYIEEGTNYVIIEDENYAPSAEQNNFYNTKTAYKERVKLGRLRYDPSSGWQYGLRISDDGGNTVMETGDNGQLWLRNMLRVGDGQTSNVTIGYNPEDNYFQTKDEQKDPNKTYYIKNGNQYQEWPGDWQEGVTYYEKDHEVINANDNFVIYDDGRLIAQEAEIHGAIYATSGQIGNMTIDDVETSIKNAKRIEIVGSNGLQFKTNTEGTTTPADTVLSLDKIGFSSEITFTNITWQYYDWSLSSSNWVILSSGSSPTFTFEYSGQSGKFTNGVLLVRAIATDATNTQYTSVVATMSDMTDGQQGPAGPEGPAGVPGATIWTADVSPTSPDYTFTIADLDGPSGNSPKVDDIILDGEYRYVISSIDTQAQTVCASERISIKGDPGAPGENAVVWRAEADMTQILKYYEEEATNEGTHSYYSLSHSGQIVFRGYSQTNGNSSLLTPQLTGNAGENCYIASFYLLDDNGEKIYLNSLLSSYNYLIVADTVAKTVTVSLGHESDGIHDGLVNNISNSYIGLIMKMSVVPDRFDNEGMIQEEAPAIAPLVFLPISNATTADLAHFAVHSRDITASVEDAGLIFNDQGLTLKSASFTMTNLSGEEQVLYADTAGNLHIKGTLDAADGFFSGRVEASEGFFHGTVEAKNGSLGKLDIDGRLKAGNLYIKSDGTIASNCPILYELVDFYFRYFETEDEIPQDGKEYFVYDENTDEYQQFSGSSFEDGILYFEREETRGEVSLAEDYYFWTEGKVDTSTTPDPNLTYQAYNAQTHVFDQVKFIEGESFDPNISYYLGDFALLESDEFEEGIDYYKQNIGDPEEVGFKFTSNGDAYVSNIELGTGAKIAKYLQIGQATFLYNSDLEESELPEGSLVKALYNKGNVLSIAKQEEDSSNFIKAISINANGIIALQGAGRMIIGDQDNSANQILISGGNDSNSLPYIQTGDFDTVSTGWRIDGDNAVFNNIVARGAIKSAVFEYNEVQAIGGTFIVRPSAIITEQINATTVILSSTEGFSVGDRCLIGKISETGNQGYTINSITNNQVAFDSLPTISDLIGSTIVDMGQKDSSNPEVGLALNSNSTETLNGISKQALTVFSSWLEDEYSEYTEAWTENGQYYEYNEETKQYSLTEDNSKDNSKVYYIKTTEIPKLKTEKKIVLGLLSDGLDIINEIAKIPSYGLYAENVYLKGSLVSMANKSRIVDSNEGQVVKYYQVSSGISSDTNIDFSPFTGNETFGHVVLWAGAEKEANEDNWRDSISTAKFRVDEFGNMYAGSGYFNGSIITDATIEASKLRTAVLEGSNNEAGEPALRIQNTFNGIDFVGGRDESEFESKFLLSADGITTKLPYDSSDVIRAFCVYGRALDNKSYASGLSENRIGFILDDNKDYNPDRNSKYSYYFNIDENSYFALNVPNASNSVFKIKDTSAEVNIGSGNAEIVSHKITVNSDEISYNENYTYKKVDGGYDLYLR